MGAACTYWGFVLRSGDAMTGNLAMGGNKITGLGAAAGAGEGARFEQLESQVHARVSKVGDAMTGNLAMGGNKVTGLGAPTATDDALRKGRAEVAAGDLKLTEGSWSGSLVAGVNQDVAVHKEVHAFRSWNASLGFSVKTINEKKTTDDMIYKCYNEGSGAQTCYARWNYHNA